MWININLFSYTIDASASLLKAKSLSCWNHFFNHFGLQTGYYNLLSVLFVSLSSQSPRANKPLDCLHVCYNLRPHCGNVMKYLPLSSWHSFVTGGGEGPTIFEFKFRSNSQERDVYVALLEICIPMFWGRFVEIKK